MMNWKVTPLVGFVEKKITAVTFNQTKSGGGKIWTDEKVRGFKFVAGKYEWTIFQERVNQIWWRENLNWSKGTRFQVRGGKIWVDNFSRKGE
jgi:hypothetical protein